MELRLSPEELRILEGLRLMPRRTFRGGVRGERLTKQKGLSIEFADHRDYAEGDDLRHLDWNALARLQTPLIKTYQDEEDLAVYLLVDSSASMEFGEPTKKQAALRLAIAFGYVALLGQDAAIPARLPLDPTAGIRPLRGRGGYPRLLKWAEGQLSAPTPRKPLSTSLRDFAAAGVRPGLAIVISDGLDPEAEVQFRVLGGRGHEVWWIQVLSPEEIDPDLEGDLRLLDSETGESVDVTANSFALKAYKENLKAHNDKLSEAVRRVGGRALSFSTNDSLANWLRGPGKRAGWAA